MNQEQLSVNLNQVKKQIQDRVKRGQEVQLVAVTKTVDVEVIQALYALGQYHIGENRPQVFLEKYHQLQGFSKLVWHFIGNLQTRQVKSIINQIDYLHSLDRLSLAQEIEKRAEKLVKCFVQVNISGEKSKSGIEPNQVLDWIQGLDSFSKIQVVGLMTMAPYGASQEDLLQYFTQLKVLQESVENQGWRFAPCKEVSMGMSEDYSQAIEAGATYIRVGSALFEGVKE